MKRVHDLFKGILLQPRYWPAERTMSDLLAALRDGTGRNIEIVPAGRAWWHRRHGA